MKINAMLLMCTLILLPALSDARCRTVGESASLGSEYGMFPLYPAERLVQAGEKRDNPALMWAGYGSRGAAVCRGNAVRHGRGRCRRPLASLDQVHRNRGTADAGAPGRAST